ncbi:hypothetical protein JCM10908_002686 [Rhodotorula pacifica]|uniref:uncharacterized protein n=1 Tax=Rhodotorula pacifica TaxID=1495444 RepID=UPI003177D0D3
MPSRSARMPFATQTVTQTQSDAGKKSTLERLLISLRQSYPSKHGDTLDSFLSAIRGAYLEATKEYGRFKWLPEKILVHKAFLARLEGLRRRCEEYAGHEVHADLDPLFEAALPVLLQELSEAAKISKQAPRTCAITHAIETLDTLLEAVQIAYTTSSSSSTGTPAPTLTSFFDTVRAHWRPFAVALMETHGGGGESLARLKLEQVKGVVRILCAELAELHVVAEREGWDEQRLQERLDEGLVLVALPPSGYRHFAAPPWEPVYRLLKNVDAALKAARERNKNGSQSDRRNNSIAAMNAILVRFVLFPVGASVTTQGGRIGSYLDQEINKFRQCYGDIPSIDLETFVDRLKNPPADVPKTRIFKTNPAFLAFAQKMQDLGRRISEVRAQSASEGLSPAETGKHMDRVLLAASDHLCQEMNAVRHYLFRLIETVYEGIPSRDIASFTQKLEDPTDAPRFRRLETATSFATFLHIMHRLTEDLKPKRIQCAEQGLPPPANGTQLDEILLANEESLEAYIWEARRHIAEAHPVASRFFNFAGTARRAAEADVYLFLRLSSYIREKVFSSLRRASSFFASQRRIRRTSDPTLSSLLVMLRGAQ